MSKASMPPPQFDTPRVLPPPPGLDPSFYDLNELLRNIANFANEGGNKTEGLLSYLSGFTENIITDAYGNRYFVLSKENGKEDLAPSAGSDHPWKVTVSESVVEGETLWDVATGTVYNIDGVSIVVPITTAVSLTDGVIYLKVGRNETSRAIISAVIESASLMPSSDYVYQYIAIAKVTSGVMIQHRFEDVRLSEILIQEAGLLKFLSVFDTTNSYELPP